MGNYFALKDQMDWWVNGQGHMLEAWLEAVEHSFSLFSSIVGSDERSGSRVVAFRAHQDVSCVALPWWENQPMN